LKRNDFRFADKVFERDIAYVDSAVGGIVPIVAHGEEVALGNHKNTRVVETTLGIAIKDVITHAVRQRFPIARNSAGFATNDLDVVIERRD
jgi:hypothetical protein